MAQKGEVDATNISSKEDGSIEASPTSVNVAEKSRIRGASGHPGIHMSSAGKWCVRVRDPITRNRIWVGSYNTLEEAINIHDKKKLEYTPLRSEMLTEGIVMHTALHQSNTSWLNSSTNHVEFPR